MEEQKQIVEAMHSGIRDADCRADGPRHLRSIFASSPQERSRRQGRAGCSSVGARRPVPRSILRGSVRADAPLLRDEWACPTCGKRHSSKKKMRRQYKGYPNEHERPVEAGGTE